MATEVSYGTHFFGELLSSGIYFLAVNPREGDLLDEEWFLRHASEPRDGVRLVESEEPLTLQVDGLHREGLAFVTPAGRGPVPGAAPRG
jgi:hypothetical protein